MTAAKSKAAVESLDTNLGSSSGDNISFHQANKAYYEDRNYNEAIKEFQAAIEYEKSQPPESLDSEIIVKSIYWLGESYLKLNQIDQALERFSQLSEHFSQHHLGRSARRRIVSLQQQGAIPKEKHKPTERERMAKQRAEAEIARQERRRQLQRVRQEKARREREAKQRAERERQEKARHEEEKQTLLKTLREHLERDFLTADNFYQTQCTAYISPEEYAAEKKNAERREKERQEKARHEEEKQTLLKTLKEHFERNFLTADNFYQTRCTAHISSKGYDTEKINYVQSWTKAKDYIDPKPDCEQAAAIGAVEGNVQVIARAGSGKTATLVTRALFLQEHCGVAPNEMLLLAFNREAAEQMRKRLTEHLQDSIPHVMTFHALAYALVHPEEILFDEPEGEQRQSRAIQAVIDRHLRDPNYYDEIRELMMAHFRDDWERIVSGGYDKTPEEMLRYRRSLAQDSLDGKRVKSFGEKVIANFLFEHNIKYRYERNFRWNSVNYHFTISTGNNRGVVIEYFGLVGDPDYDAISGEKHNYWRNKPDWRLLEFFPDDLRSNGVEGFYTLLKQKLEACEIPCNRLSEEEIWHQIQDRGIDRFTKVAVGFINRCRKLSLTPEQLAKRVNNHEYASEVEERFLNLVQVFYASYLERLQATEEEDFDGLIQKAAEGVAAGKTVFWRRSSFGDLKRIRYVFIDEYQDFSELFHRLVQAVREQNPCARFFCVGDDWQAINGFAGSDLRFFENFSQVFHDSRKLHVTTNYRSTRAIVNVGNELMSELGKRARAHTDEIGKVMIADLGVFKPTPQEEHKNGGDSLTPAVLRLVNKAINDDKRVVLLSRTNNSPPWYVNYRDRGNSSTESGLDRFLGLLRARLPDELAEKVTISTAHKYKGRQKDVVIVLDAVPQCYPLLHPDLIFTRVFGDSIERVEAEERRLFYVALTRAEKDLFILTEKDNFSPFLEDLEKKIELSRLEWSDYPPLEGKTEYITIRVGNQEGSSGNGTYAIRDLLKAEGYQWNAESKVWHSTEPAEGFSVREFAKARWSDSANGIEVRFYDYLENEVALYHVDGGQWKCISDNIRESDD